MKDQLIIAKPVKNKWLAKRKRNFLDSRDKMIREKELILNE